ncbi:MAG: CDP-diacylglycerol--serine O-phosphatidyltransferase [Deltaproteobacteria bacterium]|nr:CDP-diacylglycerol--serine O-phosphatidyltransferase [Deltaproteobacteria bacterium]MBW2171286.1 CDP-diacylglycerol--serine O-phosphatidyltransferase [Deltaproteobacteria bacterium]MBW2259124.1 CDP-diacylglycerol--serine O-phosphatidyltransferase [Deltaproteobacteria bacterium]
MKSKKLPSKRQLQRGIYVLPNLLTTANLFCGFYAIIAAIQGEFLEGAIAIMLAAVFDGLDGKIARITRTVSRFGLQYDSLSDAISFGVAPGILVYLWALQPFGRLGWLAALIFVACGTLRLARFNAQVHLIRSNFFNGLPIPAAAFMIASTVLLHNRLGGTGTAKHVTILIMIYVLSCLMVSTIKYYSFKHIELSNKMKFNMLVVIVMGFIVIAAEPGISCFLIMLSYVLSGPFTTLWLRKKRQSEAAGDNIDTPVEKPI